MTTCAARLDPRRNARDKDCIGHAAALRGMPMAVFVREAVLREAESPLTHPPEARPGSLAACLRERASSGMSRTRSGS